MHVTFLHISDYIRYFTVALQVCVSGGEPSPAGQVGLWFFFSEKVTFASSELVYMRGATWPLLKPTWGSASSNCYCSVYWFLLPKSDLVLCDVGDLYPPHLCQHEGLTALYCSGQRGSEWPGGVRGCGKNRRGRHWFLLPWVTLLWSYHRTRDLDLSSTINWIWV